MGSETLRHLLPPDQKVYSLGEFVRTFAPALVITTGVLHTDTPSLLLDDPQPEVGTAPAAAVAEEDADHDGDNDGVRQMLHAIMIAPLTTCRVAAQLTTVECREPVGTLLDNVIAVLMARQSRSRQQQSRSTRPRTRKKRSRSRTAAAVAGTLQNALTYGFVPAREGDLPSGIRGVSSQSPNETVRYCQTSPVIRELHRNVGDDLFRLLLLHTRCFLPLLPRVKPAATVDARQEDLSRTAPGRRENQGNYMLLCGPPLVTWRTATTVPTTTTGSKRARSSSKRILPQSNTSVVGSNRKRRRKQIISQKSLPKPEEEAASSSHRRNRSSNSLAANASLSRYYLLYCDAYIPHIGLPNWHPFQIEQRRQQKNEQQQRQESGSSKNTTNTNTNTNKTTNPHTTKPNESRWMLTVMFELDRCNTNQQKRLRQRLGNSALRLCAQIWQGHTVRCDYSRLLERYCRVAPDLRLENASPSSLLARLAQASTPKTAIVSFLGAVVRRVFPTNLWGSARNFHAVMRTVDAFVRLRRKERLTNKHLLHGIAVTDLCWLQHDDATTKTKAGSVETNNNNNKKRRRNRRKQQHRPRTDHATTTELTLKFLRWLFQGFLIPLLRSSFYVTETESGQELHYYRKAVWSRFRGFSLQKLLHSHHFRRVSDLEAQRTLLRQHLGLSRLRLLPKSTGMRPIAQLSRHAAVEFPRRETAKRTNITNRCADSSTTTPRCDTGAELHCCDDTRRCKRRRVEEDTTKIQVDGSSSASRQHSMPSFGRHDSSSRCVTRRLPTNVILEKVLHILTYECNRKHKPYGNGINSLHQFYHQYRNYITRMKQNTQTQNQLVDGGKTRQLFFAKVDIEKCYDRINQDELLNLVDIMYAQTYVVQSVKMHRANFRLGGENATRYKKIVDAVDDHRSFYKGEHAIAQRNYDTVFDLCKCSLVGRKEVLSLLREHIKQNMVLSSGRHGRKVLQQSSGISQGSALSMLLCNLYYGKVEESFFCDSSKAMKMIQPTVGDIHTKRQSMENDFLLSRFVDDFIFITTDKKSFESFLNRTYRGSPKLGAQINPNKTLVNTDTSVQIEMENGTTKQIPVCSTKRRNRNGVTLFSWCGLLFDTQTGETFIDYKRFRHGKVQNGLTIDYDGSEGKKMQNRMRSFIFPRCLPILYDPSINSFDTIITNFYQMILFAAAKTAEYLRGHSSMLSNSSRNAYNIDYVLRCIRDLSQFALKKIRDNFGVSYKNRSDLYKMAKIDQVLGSFICWKGFYDVFLYLSDMEDITVHLAQKYASSFAKLRHKKKMEIRRATARALEDFQISKMIRK